MMQMDLWQKNDIKTYRVKFSFPNEAFMVSVSKPIFLVLPYFSITHTVLQTQ